MSNRKAVFSLQKLPTQLIVLVFCSLVKISQADEFIELSRAELKAERQFIVSSTLLLNNKMGEIFWPLYREYRADIDKLDDRLFSLISVYMETTTKKTMTDKEASHIVDTYIDIETDRLALKKIYIKKFRKKIPVKTVARYFQIENKLDSVVNYKISSQIPLAYHAYTDKD